MELTRYQVLFCLIQTLQHVTGFVNLSVNKTADMSSSQYSDKWLADEAVDGDASQKVAQGSCAVTSDNFHKQAWWRVDLGDVYVLKSVTIYYRKESDDPDQSLTHQLSGFAIYVADTLNWWIGTRCYLHNNGVNTRPGPSDILTVPCNVTGRYVTVYKQRNISCTGNQRQVCAIFQLCEVQVLSCEDGTYGASCSNNCSGNCLYGVHCNRVHGGCDGGCATGYRRFYCNDVCSNGSFGLKCYYNCGKCRELPCNHINGTCPNGCAPGWRGVYCNETCNIGTFGQNCKETCSQYCRTTKICNHVSGTCDGGCQAGWINANCNKSCGVGRYGINCTKNCSENCVNSFKCRVTNGHYVGGCSEGWKGDVCNQTCGFGRYGINCTKNCSENCVNSFKCRVTNGHCVGGCSEGWKGDVCNQNTYKSDENKDAIIITISVTCGVLTTVLCVALLFTCLRLRHQFYLNMKGLNNKNTIQQELRQVQMSVINDSTQGNVINKETIAETRNTATYEDLMPITTDSNAYETLQQGR